MRVSQQLTSGAWGASLRHCIRNRSRAARLAHSVALALVYRYSCPMAPLQLAGRPTRGPPGEGEGEHPRDADLSSLSVHVTVVPAVHSLYKAVAQAAATWCTRMPAAVSRPVKIVREHRAASLRELPAFEPSSSVSWP